jgi:hypothetical protein
MTMFYPRKSRHDSERYRLRLDIVDSAKINRRGRDTGNSYDLMGASCGMPSCMCDAVVVWKAETKTH